MQYKEELLAAVDQAMSALGIIRQYLLQSPDETPDETYGLVPEPVAEPVPETVPEPVPLEIDGMDVPVYSVAKEMRSAARTAAERCSEWQYKAVSELPVDKNMMLYTCEEEDRKNPLDPRQEGSFYLVSPEGAIGRTDDNCVTIEWIFLPMGTGPDALPASFRSPEPEEPEAVPAPELFTDPEPAAVPDPVPEPSLQAVDAPAPSEPLPAPEAPPAAAPEPDAAKRPRFCRNCGTPLNEGSRFCVRCGQKVDA
ncbi:MAG: zinc ribbon domain-containing protein [Oscillospiraceae bacterium]|nr:zinc ribbon domain-containing protein [Oscillospiraceae bacterium]